MALEICYPQGKEKCLTFSYDDNQIFDRRLIDIFNRNGLKATFHLNSGTIGTKSNGNEYVTKEEIPELYKGHEVACHGVNHPFFSQLPINEFAYEVMEDKRNLETIVHYPIRGMSYPFGEFSEGIVTKAASVGIEYSRTVNETNGYNWPTDFMTWHPSCHHNVAFTNTELIDRFLNPLDYMKLNLYIWGHSFEFHRENTWDKMEALCEKLSGDEKTWYATNIMVKDYIEAVRGLVMSADCNIVYNPSAVEVFYKADEKICSIKPGEMITL